MKVKKFLLLALVFVSVLALAACGDKEKDKREETGRNDEYTLILQSSTMDGIFNPFFYSSSYDGDVVNMVNVSLLTLDPNAAVVSGDEYPTVALQHSIWYTNDLTNYTPKERFEEGDYVVYEMVLKNGMKFSDGQPITAEDVLFNFYVYLDMAYDGLSTLYTLPILGLKEYRTQVSDPEAYQELAAEILADDTRVAGYQPNDKYTEEQHDTYWEAFGEAGATFAGEIVAYVASNYLTDAYIKAYFHPDLTADQVRNDAQLKIAYGMVMWGYGELSEDMTQVIGASGDVYSVDELTNLVYFEEMLKANSDEDGKIAFPGGYQGLSEYESAGGDFVANAAEIFTLKSGDVGSVKKITGLVEGTKVVNGQTHQTVKVILTKQDPKAILSLGITVAPKHYYTANYAYSEEELVNYGAVYNSPKFMEHLKKVNAQPLGAGPYKFVKRDPGDGTVYFERNDLFYTMGGENVYNANIKKVAFKIVSSGAEFNAIKSGDVHYATVSASIDVMNELTNQAKYQNILVDNLGYGYICVNPEVYPNLYERIALQTAFDITKVYEYYPNGLAEVITRSMSQVSWAYPAKAEAIYKFDETLQTTIEYFKRAGFEFNEDTGKFVGVDKTYEFFIPSAANDHPAGPIFLKTVDLLASIGINAKITTDEGLIARVNAGGCGIYALAWQASVDPDLYQVYHYMSQANSVQGNGIVYLYEHGNDNTLGTLEVKKLDGTTEVMNQKQALEYLGFLIVEARAYMLIEERKPIYEAALNLLAQLAIEIPTYQRKNLFVYDGTVIDSKSLSKIVTPYWGPMAEIWKVRFVYGTPGNEKVDKK